MLRLPLSVLAIIVLGAVMSCGGEDGTPSPTAASPTPLATVFPPRPEDRLTMCVDTAHGVPDSIRPRVVERIRATMATIVSHKNYTWVYSSRKEPVVDLGCPAPPADSEGLLVDEPGFYRVYVFVAPPPLEMRRFTQEWISCGGPSRCERTVGTYVTPPELCYDENLVDILEHAVGLDGYQVPVITPFLTTPKDYVTPTPCL